MNSGSLIRKYGTVLEICSALGLAAPQEFLPGKKEKIEVALLTAYAAADNQEEKDSIGSALIHLSSFVPIEDALIVVRFSRQITDDSQRSAHPEDRLLGGKYEQITDNMNRDAERYLRLMQSIDSKQGGANKP